jgi:hypothetical protein
MKFNAQETIKRAEEDYGLGKGQYFKVKEGPNKIRLLSECVPYQSEFKGQTNIKFLSWIIDRADNQIKLYFMPTTILNAIGGLQASDDFGFEDVPMPYDITIMAKGAGTKDVEYTVVGARTNTPLTPTELQEFESKPSVDEVIVKLKEKQGGESGQVQAEPSQPPTGIEGARQTAEDIRDGKPIAQKQPGDLNVEDIPF